MTFGNYGITIRNIYTTDTSKFQYICAEKLRKECNLLELSVG